MSGMIALGTKVNVSGFEQGFKRAKESIASFTSSTTSTLGSIGLASMGVSALFSTIKNVVGEPLKLSANMESTATSFEVLLGSAEQAQQVMSQLKTFGKETPFEFTEVADASKKFLAFGFSAKELIPTLTSVGNLASAIGGNFGELAEVIGKMKVGGVVQGEDINQLLGRGIPITRELAKVMGVAETAIKDMASKGQIQFKHVEAAISNLTNGSGQMAGMMQKQSTTLGGVWSNFSDGITQTLTLVGDKLVATFGIKDLLNNASTFLDAFSAVAFDVFDGLVAGVQWCQPIIEGVGEALVGVWHWISEEAVGAWAVITSVISFNSKKFSDDITAGFRYVEFGLKNFTSIMKLGAYAFVLGIVQMGNNAEYFLTVVIPKTLDWFQTNWRNIFYNIGEFTLTVFKNLASNIVDVVSNIPNLLAGTVNFSDLWKPLTTGAKYAIVDALDIPDRVKGKIETQLEDSVRQQSTQLAQRFEDFNKAKDEAINNPARQLSNDNIVKLLPMKGDKTGYQEKKIAATGSTAMAKLQEAATIGSKEANASILRVMFGTKEKDPAKQTADNTKNAVTELKKLNQTIVDLKTGNEVGI